MTESGCWIGQSKAGRGDIVKKDEAEQGIRHLCGLWAKEKGYRQTSDEMPSFSEFVGWVRDRYPQYLDFRSRMGAMYDAEAWFDEEFRQTWRR